MIENANESKNPSTGFVDIPRYIGVGSINVVAINPNNEKLRKFGWNIPEDAEEPNYIIPGKDGAKPSTRIRFLVQITDLEEKPVIPVDFFIGPEILVNKEGSKCMIIDAYGRTAWGTKDEITSKRIPQYADGPARISAPYKGCHKGEEAMVNFLMKYLNVTPLQIFDKAKQRWIDSKNPGRLTIDNWPALCAGNVNELAGYLAMQPDNRVKVVFGVRTTEDNKTYQTFLNNGYISNGAVPDRNTGEYTTAQKLIKKFMDGREDAPYIFSAEPIKEWKAVATDVQDNSGTLFDENNTVDPTLEDDLPF